MLRPPAADSLAPNERLGIGDQWYPPKPEPDAFYRLIRSGDPTVFAASYAYNVAPVTDNAPFFFFTIKTSDVLRGILSGSGRGMDWRINLGVVVLGMVLVISTAAVLLFLIVPMALAARTPRPSQKQAGPGHAPGHPQQSAIGNRRSAIPLLYFIAIGLGYILAEIAFIQRFVLFLGHPTYALTVVIFLMLLASGAGSWLSRRWLVDPLRVWTPLVLVIAILFAYVWVLPPVLRALVGLPFPVKLIIGGAALVPLGLAMGMPFPSGLRALAAGDTGDGNTIEWAWALNAASSVLGSVLAMVVAIQFGLNWTLICAAAAYALALVFLPRLGAVSQTG